MTQGNKTNTRFRPKLLLLTLCLAAAVCCTACKAAPAAESTSIPAESEVQSELPTEWDATRPYADHESAVGWLRLPGTEIDNVVLQAQDNDTWLRTNEEGKQDVWGSYFVDYECKIPEEGDLSRVTIIYGHSKDDTAEGPRFCELKKYAEEEFCKENSTLYFHTPHYATAWKIVSSGKVSATYQYLDPEPDDETFAELCQTFLDISSYDFGETLTPEDRLMILSTCTSDSNQRFVVVAKLVETQPIN